MQSGHGAPELKVLQGQLTSGSEGVGREEVEITAWSMLGEDTKGTRSRGEIQVVLGLSAAYS